MTRRAEIQSTTFVYHGEQAHISCIIDISKRKKAEEEKKTLELQLQQTQKLESLGVLAGGIAHDFNNILAIIMGNCALAEMDEEHAQCYIAPILKASDRGAELCRQMLSYAGRSKYVQEIVNFGALVDETVNMLRKTIPKNAVIKSDFPSDIAFVQGDASQLSQIVMNLIINASEAIDKEQGEIRVSLAEKVVNEGQTDKDYNGKLIPPGRYVCLEVSDTGCGMDEETKWRIFEPFYTTKFTGRGLGMSAVLGIITSHEGALQLTSRPGEGTTFEIYLPTRDMDSAIGETVEQKMEFEWQGSGTILLVEDESQVRKIANILLTKLGFTVIEAENGKEALDLYQKYASDVTLVLTDMGMPVMDGYALFHALKQIKPSLPIIIASGFGDADVTVRIDRNDLSGLLSKPYTPEKLRTSLSAAMAGIQVQQKSR